MLHRDGSIDGRIDWCRPLGRQIGLVASLDGIDGIVNRDVKDCENPAFCERVYLVRSTAISGDLIPSNHFIGETAA